MLRSEYLDHIPDSLIELYTKAELAILSDMARRISQYDYYIPAAQYQQQRLLLSGTTYDEIMKALTALTGKSNIEITLLMKEAGMETVAVDNSIYAAAGKTPKPFLSTPAVQAVYAAGLKKTKALFRNLTRTTAAEGGKFLTEIMDTVYMQVTSGAFDANTAIRNAIKTLANNGLPAFRYPSGRIDNIEVAVRRAIISGVNQTCAQIQLAYAEEMGAEYFEVSAHAGARPEHAAFQGGVYKWNK